MDSQLREACLQIAANSARPRATYRDILGAADALCAWVESGCIPEVTLDYTEDRSSPANPSL
jgi:hypothetical protein